MNQMTPAKLVKLAGLSGLKELQESSQLGRTQLNHIFNHDYLRFKMLVIDAVDLMVKRIESTAINVLNENCPPGLHHVEIKKPHRKSIKKATNREELQAKKQLYRVFKTYGLKPFKTIEASVLLNLCPDKLKIFSDNIFKFDLVYITSGGLVFTEKALDYFETKKMNLANVGSILSKT